MANRKCLAAVAALAVMLVSLRDGSGADAQMADGLGGRVRAPELAADAWLNTERPLTLMELRGQVVLLDFWTYCCINCIHVFPDLKYLEDKYHDQPFVVIGVHSGKFTQEKDPENIRKAILRHNIEHPVAVDSSYRIWNAYAVRAWPTFVMIDPEGYVVGTVAGEGHRELLDRTVDRLLQEHRVRGTLGEPMRFRLERSSFTPGVLQFPGKVLADAERGRLFIADTNHHRVLEADLDGRVQHVIGSGEMGLVDGDFASAQFRQPQGMALSKDGGTLYVADTENHAIRAIDLEARQVSILAGTGRQSTDFRTDGPASSTPLASPWDLVRVDSRLYIAMAGTHQIWVLDLDAQRVSVFAGTGREFRIDGPNTRAAFAQPSGLATDGRTLYVADSEISTIRTVGLGRGGRTATLAGSGGLFDFGHRDGIRGQVRFQHPKGVALDDERLFVADTFNHLIRAVETTTGRTTTWLGAAGSDPDTPEEIGFFEPGGLSVGGGTLYVADTNHHRIVAIDIADRRARVLNIVLPEQDR